MRMLHFLLLGAKRQIMHTAKRIGVVFAVSFMLFMSGNLLAIGRDGDVDRWVDGTIFKNPKVELKTGEILRANKLVISGSNIILYYSTWPTKKAPKTIASNDLRCIQVATKHYLPHGAILGAVLMAGVMALMDNNDCYGDYCYYEETYHAEYEYDEYGRQVGKSVTIYEEGSFETGTKVAFVIGGAIVGALIGHNIRGKWVSFYPPEKPSNTRSGTISFGISLSDNRFNTPVLAMRLVF